MMNSHPTWKVHDSSKVQEYATCPRKYFFRYVLGWESDLPNKHLVHGEGWHRAMESLLQGEGVRTAFERYESYYRQFFSSDRDEANTPKNPAYTLLALTEYEAHYNPTQEFAKVLHTEVSGQAGIGDGRSLHFRLDAVVEDDKGKIVALEHKTSGYLSETWAAQWPLKIQTGTYTHALNCIFEADRLFGVIISGTFFKKSGPNFLRQPVRFSMRAMNRWMQNVHHWFDLIEWDFQLLEAQHEEDDFFSCFHQNTESCIKYNTVCPFYDFCMGEINPLRYASGPVPAGFRINYWDPRERDAQANKVINIDDL